MAQRNANSLFNSLQGKIRLAATGLAFFACSFGLIGYLTISFFFGETIYAVFVPLLLISLSVIIFGWWLANELIDPITRVALLAKSLERNAVVSLPKTTGWLETDQILETLHRSSQQMQTVIGLMDAVAAGNTNVTLTPLENADRLCASFQKLLAKVTDSIDAKQKLEKLETSIADISEEIALVRRGNLEVKIKTDHSLTADVAETLEYLLENLKQLAANSRKNAAEVIDSVDNAEKIVRGVISAGENKLAEISGLSTTLAHVPHIAGKIHDELAGSVSSADLSLEKAKRGTTAAQANLQGITSLRSQIQESIKKVGNLNERAREVTKIAKAIEDLARRTNLIALNASIQAAENKGKNQGLSLLAEEVERLAARAEKTGKDISSLNQTIAAEISEAENSLQTTIGEAANLSRFAIETSDALEELEKHVNRFSNLQTKLAQSSAGQVTEIEKMLAAFTETMATVKQNIGDLKGSKTQIAAVIDAAERIQSATTHLTLPETTLKIAAAAKTASFEEAAHEYESVVTI